MDGTSHDDRKPRTRRGRVVLSSVVAGLGLTLTASAAFGGVDKLASTVRDHVYCKVVRDCVYDDPPKTRVIRGPHGVTSDPTPTFRFKSNESNVTYRCRLDGESYDECDNPYTSARLDDGRHRLDVYAVDSDGVPDESPAHARFAVDTDDPNCSVRGRHKTRDRTPSFSVRANERGSKFEYKLDNGRYHRSGNKVKLHKVKPGRHLLQVRAIDRAGNQDRSPDKHRFKVVGKKRHRH